MKIKSAFVKIAQGVGEVTGHPFSFVVAFSLILIWAITGPLFGFSDTWQLVINTGTTIITFLMVFLIQSTQNRDTEALHLKLDELIRATEGAHLALIDIEKLDDDEFQAFRRMYDEIAEKAKKRLNEGGNDINCPEIEIAPLYFPQDEGKINAVPNKRV